MDNSTSQTGREKMMKFLDTRDFGEKVDILKDMYVMEELDDFIIDNLAASLDYVIDDGDIEYRYNQLRSCIETRAKYEISRFR